MKKESITVRIILIVVIILLLLVPLAMIESMIDERQKYRNEALSEIYRSWGYSQVVAGPVLTFEKKTEKQNKEGVKYSETTYKHFLPAELTVDCSLIPEIRYRGIYEIVLYKAALKIKGSFNYPQLNEPGPDEEVYLSFNVSDLRGVQENVVLKWNDLLYDVNPGLKKKNVFRNGFYSSVEVVKEKKFYSFVLELKLRGSEMIQFLPLGQLTRVKVSSPWVNPSFMGSYLPSTRNISDKNFTAEWKINHFNRDYPQVWDNQDFDIFSGAFGVELLMPVDEYQKTMRTSKYGVMIIILTFVSFFMIEIFSRKVIHPVQYLLVGFALILFYSVLLSLSEYIIFSTSYLIASLGIIILTALYVKSIYSNFRIGMLIGFILLFFYGFMYVILQLQDYSLLLGNIALFIILAVIMFITRKINWYDVLSSKTDTTSR